jgi:hypothetical protein
MNPEHLDLDDPPTPKGGRHNDADEPVDPRRGDGRAVMRWALALWLCLAPTLAAAHLIDLGSVELTGTFTLTQGVAEPLSSPLGTFDTPLTVVDVEGIFDGFVPLGATLPAGPLLVPLDWTLGSLTFHTTYYQVTGADWVGRNVLAPADGLSVTGLEGFEAAYPDFWVFWQFDAPPFDGSDPRHGLPVTGPIQFHIGAAWESGAVPEPATLWLALPGLALVGLWRRNRLNGKDGRPCQPRERRSGICGVWRAP